MTEPFESPEFQSLRLQRKEQLTDDTYLLELVHPDNKPLPSFEAGAHVTLETPQGIRREYSLSNDPAETHHYVLAIKTEPEGNGSVHLAVNFRPGDHIKVSRPKNNFPLQAANEYLFIAGGIGITPILSMMRQLKRRGMHHFRLVYCTRSRETTPFLDVLTGPELGGHVTLHHDQGDPDQAYDLRGLLATVSNAHIYTCGPGPMMNAIRSYASHWPEDAIHMEDYSGEW